MSKQSKFYVLFKWIILVAAYAFLAYKLVTFENYETIISGWKMGWTTHLSYLIIVFLLLPLNWLLETCKWKFLLRKLEILNLNDAFKSVMIGNTTAFFTPNRLGEFPGRSVSLSKGKKLQGITIGVLGSVSQTVTIMLIGIPAAWFYFTHNQIQFNTSFYTFSLFLLLISLLLVYFFLPRLCQSLNSYKFFHRIAHLLDSLTVFTNKDLFGVLLISLVRYLVFCTQFYFLLGFFGVELTPFYGAVAIATNYLFITFTPSLAFSEGAVRASVAILVIGAYSANTAGIALAGIFIWLINFVVPMLIGSVILGRKK